MKKIVLTGGGTAGHVMPNIALLNYLGDFEVHYIGSLNGMEKTICASHPEVTYHGIHTGKLRRYLSIENIKDYFRFRKGIFEARKLLKQLKPDIIFSKGGYVAVPVAIAARGLKIPLITHESDITPGLANKIITNVACTVLTTFPETVPLIKGGKGKYSGPPIRPELFKGDREKGLAFAGFKGDKPVMLVMGGSKGSRRINTALYGVLEDLCKRFDVIHICGDRNVVENGEFPANYRQYPFIGEELPDVLAATDYIITRGGSNSIHEFAALQKPMIIIPLSRAASRGDQILNADSFVERGMAIKLEEEELSSENLLKAVDKLVDSGDSMREALAAQNFGKGVETIYNEIIAELDRRSLK